MTNSYTRRYERGGKFKEPRLGDLGRGAYKRQQDTQIAWITEQQKQAFTHGSQWLKDDIGKASREQTHRDKLQNLETKAYDTRRRAIEKRGKTEYDFWIGKADQYKTEEKFWGNFSTTYARQWGNLAASTAKVAGKMQAENYMQRVRDANLTDISHEQDIHSVLSKKTTDGIIVEAQDLRENGDDQGAADLLSIPLLARPFIATAFKDWVEQNESDIRQMLNIEASKEGSPLTSAWKNNPDSVINNYIVNRAKAWGLSGTGSEVRQAADLISHKQHLQDNQEALGVEYNKRNTNYLQSIEHLNSAYKA